MDYQSWKAANAGKHISEQVRGLLNELESLKKHAEATTSQTFHSRLNELKAFEESVEKMLVAEWTRVKDIIAGHGNEYN